MVIDATFKIISVISGRPVFFFIVYRIEYNNKYVHHGAAYLSTH